MYVIPPGDEGVVIEDQSLPAKDILEAIKQDFNNHAINKVVFVTTEVIDTPVEGPFVPEEPKVITKSKKTTRKK